MRRRAEPGRERRTAGQQTTFGAPGNFRLRSPFPNFHSSNPTAPHPQPPQTTRSENTRSSSLRKKVAQVLNLWRRLKGGVGCKETNCKFDRQTFLFICTVPPGREGALQAPTAPGPSEPVLAPGEGAFPSGISATIVTRFVSLPCC